MVRRPELPVALNARQETPCALILQIINGSRLGKRCDGRDGNRTSVFLVEVGEDDFARERQVLHWRPTRLRTNLTYTEVRVAGEAADYHRNGSKVRADQK